MNQLSEDRFPYQYAATQRFTVGTPRGFRLAGMTKLVTFLRSTEDDPTSLCLWLADPINRTETLVADPNNLAVGEVPEAELKRRERARESAGGIVSYSLSPDGAKACFALGGELFVSDLATRTTEMLESPGSVFDPRLSPDGQKVAFVSARSLYVIDLRTGHDRELVGSSDALVSWGRAEFIAGEEMNRHRGYWWSPDSAALLATRSDNSQVQSWWIANPASPNEAAAENRYPAAGTKNAEVGLYWIDLESPGPPAELDWRQGQFEYLVDVVWAKDHPPLVVRQTRDQTVLDIAKVSLEGGVESAYTITDPVWVDIHPGTPSWYGDQLVTIEDISDRRSLVIAGTPIKTPGWQIKSLVGIESGQATVTAWETPSEIRLLTLDLETSEITALSETGRVSSGLSNGSLVLVSSGSLEWPGARTTVSLTDAPGDQPMEIVSRAETPVLTAGPQILSLGPNRISSALLLPSWHDGVQSLPVLCDPYAGPHAQRVVKTHNAHLVSQWFAELGYAVLVSDGRGTPGKSPRWEKAVHHDLASPVLDDQIEALDAAAEMFDFLDLNRVGIRGWSFGGYLAALAVLTRPDRFHCGLAGAPVTSWELYDTHYTERYLGNPRIDPTPYVTSGLLDLPGRWDQDRDFPPLMLIHGLADDNVVAAHTLQLSSALLSAGLAHQVLPLTGVTHMTPQPEVAENLLKLQARFLSATLLPEIPK